MKRRSILFAIFFAALLVALLLPTSAQGNGRVWIQGHNLKLTDHVSMIYYIGDENLPDGAELGVAIYRSPKESYTKATADALLETVGGTECGFSKFYYEGLADYEMTDLLYARPYYTLAGNTVYGELDSYSVLQYAMEQTGKTGYVPNASLASTLEWLLEEGAKAQIAEGYKTDCLPTGNFGYLSLDGAVLSDGVSQNGGFAVGSEVTLTGIGGVMGWYKDGARVGSGHTLNVTVTTEPQSYTAVCEEHDYEAVLVTPATCTAPATYQLTCACGQTSGEPYALGDALGHDYEEVVTAPTCTAAGYTTHTCSRCGDSYTDSETSALGHDYGYNTGYCSRCGDGNVIYESNGDGTCKVVGLKSKTYDDVYVVIAETTPNGDRVTSIAENAFVGSHVEEIIIPKTVTRIEVNAFYDVPIMAVYYGANKACWDSIDFEEGNGMVYYADVYCYTETKPAADGMLWHWVNGELTVWPPNTDEYGELHPLH